MGSTVRSKKMAVSEPFGRLRVPSPQQPGLAWAAFYLAQVGQARLAIGGGLGRGVAARLVLVATPLSNSPPQGGREQTVRVASATMDSIFKQQPSTHSVVAGLDPAIHLLRKCSCED